MNTVENKKLKQDILSALSKGNDAPLIEAMSDDMEWTWMGAAVATVCTSVKVGFHR